MPSILNSDNSVTLTGTGAVTTNLYLQTKQAGYSSRKARATGEILNVRTSYDKTKTKLTADFNLSQNVSLVACGTECSVVSPISVSLRISTPISNGLIEADVLTAIQNLHAQLTGALGSTDFDVMLLNGEL